MIKATQRNTDSRKSRGNVIYSESFGKNGRTSFISGSAAPEDFWAERSQEEAHRRNTDIRIAARRSREQVMHMNRRYAFFMAFLVAAMTMRMRQCRSKSRGVRSENGVRDTLVQKSQRR